MQRILKNSFDTHFFIFFMDLIPHIECNVVSTLGVKNSNVSNIHRKNYVSVYGDKIF